jgi:hypothetical protein
VETNSLPGRRSQSAGYAPGEKRMILPDITINGAVSIWQILKTGQAR